MALPFNSLFSEIHYNQTACCALTGNGQCWEELDLRVCREPLWVLSQFYAASDRFKCLLNKL